jgi:predicted transcriptional regulator
MEVRNVTYDIKDILLQYIFENPGIRYRELLRLTGLTNGVLTYHLAILERSDRIKVDRKSRITRYYSPDISNNESNIIGCLRPHTARQIIVFMLEHDLCTFNEIVEHTKKAPSTVSWHLKRFRDSGIVTVQVGEYTLYRIASRALITEILSKYRESFMDKVVSNYIEMIDEL